MIPQEVLDQIIEAGTYAATGKNGQSPIIVAVTDKDVRDRLSALNGEIMGIDSDPFLWSAGGSDRFGEQKCSDLCVRRKSGYGNLMLAAHALGVGSCWIHRAKQEFERPEGKEILKSLGIEGDYEGIGHCILGYPKGEYPKAAPRKKDWVYYVK